MRYFLYMPLIASLLCNDYIFPIEMGDFLYMPLIAWLLCNDYILSIEM